MDLATMKCRVVIDEAVRASLALGVAAPGIWDGWVRMKWLERATGALVESRTRRLNFCLEQILYYCTVLALLTGLQGNA
jgi:hypothetical protein